MTLTKIVFSSVSLGKVLQLIFHNVLAQMLEITFWVAGASLSNPSISGIKIVCTLVPLSAGGLNLLPNFQKGGLGRIPIFRGGLLGKRGLAFLRGGGVQFLHKKTKIRNIS